MARNEWKALVGGAARLPRPWICVFLTGRMLTTFGLE